MATDILMMIMKDANSPMAGESRAVANTKDELTSDFVFGKYVEIEDFDVGISVSESDSSESSSSPITPPPSGTGSSSGDHKPAERKKSGGKFSKFIQGANVARVDGKPGIYPASFDEVNVNRQMDKASPLLFQQCFNTKSLAQVSVVKRKAAGTAASVGHIPYLRIDFTDVLITDLGWSISNDVVKEKLKFVYRTINIRYRPQNNDGSPGIMVPFTALSMSQSTDKGK